jgi:hypothetical protein
MTSPTSDPAARTGRRAGGAPAHFPAESAFRPSEDVTEIEKPAENAPAGA